MPAALTDHLDHNPEENILQGRVGYVESWILDDREDSKFDEEKRILRYPPRAVLVQYMQPSTGDYGERLSTKDGDIVEKP